MSRVTLFWLLMAGGLVSIPSTATESPALASEAEPADPAAAVLARIGSPELRALGAEVLERNPDLSRLRARAAAARSRAPQVSSLPDPVATLTVFALPPETRVGPQRAVASLMQRFPWFGKLKLREQAALLEATATRHDELAARLRVLTDARKLFQELTFLSGYSAVVAEDRDTLRYYEQLARARYASGVGLGQGVIKLQAEITKSEVRLLEIATHRADVLARLDALRDRTGTETVVAPEILDVGELDLDVRDLRDTALAHRPEIAAADARIAAQETRIELARKDSFPDVTLGLTHGWVDRRRDDAGQANPPEGNGADILGFSAGVNLPVWRGRIDAALEESLQGKLEAEAARRAVSAKIGDEIGDLGQRLPLTWKRLRLFEDVLVIQADQALRSAEAAYAAGTVNALDLLDAERILLEVRISLLRTQTDYANGIAELEGAVAMPLESREGT